MTLLIKGGLWKQAPCNFLRQFSISEAFSIGEWNLTIPTYSLPADCCDLTKRVALFKHTIKHPVTLGSNVPLWPVFSTFNIFFTHATISWLDGFAGLSKLITPYFKCSDIGLSVNELLMVLE